MLESKLRRRFPIEPNMVKLNFYDLRWRKLWENAGKLYRISFDLEISKVVNQHTELEHTPKKPLPTGYLSGFLS